MLEQEQRTLPRIVSTPLKWFRRRWNAAYYGFPEGESARDRMEMLCGQPVIKKQELRELLKLITDTGDSSLQARMAEKIADGAKQLVASRRLHRQRGEVKLIWLK